MNLLSILSTICLGVAGNILYFIVFGGHFPECGAWTLVFFNLAFLSLFLPLVSKRVYRSQYLSSGAGVICSAYFIIEVIIAVSLLDNDSSIPCAIAWQSGLLFLFLFVFLFNESANLRTHNSLKHNRENHSHNLIEARAIITDALSQENDSEHKKILRSAFEELSAIQITSADITRDIEKQILDSAKDLTGVPSVSNLQQFSRHILRRNAMLRSFNQF